MSLRISRILHAGYVFDCDGTQIAFDPIFENPFSRNCYAFPNVNFDQEQIKKLSFAAVFISHFHDDHCSLESLNLLPRETPIYIYCLHEELITWIRELGFQNVISISLNRTIKVGPFEVTARRALDAEVDSIFHIQALGKNILNVVDSWIDPETMEQFLRGVPWDLVLWPFQTMRELEVLSPRRFEPSDQKLPEEWLEQLKILNPENIVPSSCQFIHESWSWYNHAFFPISYRDFQIQIDSILPQTHVQRMNPGTTFELNGSKMNSCRSLTWIHPVGDQNVDYIYQPDLKPPTTAEVASQFPPLTEDQRQQVIQYCQSGLLQKYRSLEAPDDSYFSNERIWRLSLFDHLGGAIHFYYLLKGAQIQLMASPMQPLAWATELPMFKLHSALTTGESLTSMYVRSNEPVFSNDIEEMVASVDLVEDPLVRCLFNQEFGSYQKDQLERLRKSLI